MVRTTQPDDAALTGEQPTETPTRGVDALPSLLLAAAVALLLVVVLGKTRKKAIAKSREVLPSPQARLADLRQRAENDPGIEARVAVAADQIRELTAVLDTRIEMLDTLVQQADERIRQLGSNGSPAAPASFETHDAGSPNGDGQKRAIYELADQGHSPAEIAAKLGQHAGKVELILALRRV